jgi:nucleoside-diphosphate-sugar epimerase
MRVFLTGATGFIGTVLVTELRSAGHSVLGLARSDAGAAALKASGVEVHRGDLEDLDSLRTGAAKADAVIHLAFNHDFSKFAENCVNDRKAIEALGSVLVGSNHPLIVTSGVGFVEGGRLRTENDPHQTRLPRVSEAGADAVQALGVKVMTVRLPQVHDTAKQGLITPAIAIARANGVSAYVGDGQNRFAAVHVSDAARLYRLVLEQGTIGHRYNAVAEEGVTFKDIAEAIGRALKIPAVSLSPEEAGKHFGWLAMFAGLSLAASSTLTQKRLGWHPTGPGLIADLDNFSG